MENQTNQQPSQASALVLLAEVMGLYARDMTSLETELWPKLISEFGDAAIIRFLAKHVERSVFAPKPADVLQALRPTADNASSAFEELYRKVMKVGPYMSPVFDDPAIAGAVTLLGGWVKVNEQMPDPTHSRFDYEAYANRFDLLYKQSSADLLLGRTSPQPVLGMHDKRLRVTSSQSPELLQISKTNDQEIDTVSHFAVSDDDESSADVCQVEPKRNHFSEISSKRCRA